MCTREKQKVLSVLQMIPVQIHSRTFLCWNDSPQNHDIRSRIPHGAQGLQGEPGGAVGCGEYCGEETNGWRHWQPVTEGQGGKWEKRGFGQGVAAQKTTVHNWKEKEMSRIRDVKRQGLTAVYSLWSCSCSEDNPQMTHGSLDSAWKATITWRPRCTKTVLPAKGTSWLQCQNLSEDRFKNEGLFFFFCTFLSWGLLTYD